MSTKDGNGLYIDFLQTYCAGKLIIGSLLSLDNNIFGGQMMGAQEYTIRSHSLSFSLFTGFPKYLYFVVLSILNYLTKAQCDIHHFPKNYSLSLYFIVLSAKELIETACGCLLCVIRDLLFLNRSSIAQYRSCTVFITRISIKDVLYGPK